MNGATADINLSNTIATANNNTLLETLSSGTTIFDAQASTLRGVITTDASSTSRVNLTQGAVWTMTGNSNATLVTNANSQIIYTPPTEDPTLLGSYKTLTAVNYLGAEGTIQLNTYLGDDSAPSDRLAIDSGTATGRTILEIRKTTGPGGLTVANGILVVQTLDSATTTPGAFALAGVVEAGPFEYRLFRGAGAGAIRRIGSCATHSRRRRRPLPRRRPLLLRRQGRLRRRRPLLLRRRRRIRCRPLRRRIR